MALDPGIVAQRVEGREAFGQRHLVVQPVQAFVTQPAQFDAVEQHLARIVPAEVAATVHLAWDQVVKGQLGMPAAQVADADVGFTGHARILRRQRRRIKRMDDFERQLYAWLAQIPAGRVVTYGQLAKLIGRPHGARWVGRRLGRLPAGSALPWHRVLNARGRSSLPPNAGGSNRQLRLLQREGVLVVDGRVSLVRYRWDPFAV